MRDARPLLLLVDGHASLFRAYHGSPPLHNSSGEPTGAMLGMLKMLKTLREDFQPDCFAVVFDARGPTFRHALYSEYKANRPPMPDDLRQQIDPLQELIRAQGVPLLSVEGVEADDVIGTLAVQSEAAGMDTLIASNDKDFAQLVNERIILYNPLPDRFLDERGVEQKFGVPPGLIVDYLALVGDSVDNIPGVPGVGPKTAAKWLRKYRGLDAIVDNASAIVGKVGEHLRSNLEQLALCKALAALKTDVSLDCRVTELRPGAGQREQLAQLYDRWEFRALRRDLERGRGEPVAPGRATRNPFQARVLDLPNDSGEPEA